MSAVLHPLLHRQLRKAAIDPGALPERMARLLDMIDQAYRQSDDDRKMLERSLELSSQELLEANSQMRAIFQAFPDILLVVDPQGRIIDFRGGHHYNELLHKRSQLGKNLTESQLSSFFPGLQTAFEQARRHIPVEPLVTHIADENDHYFELRMENVDTLGVIFIIRDISAGKRAQKALSQERERLWVTLESIGEGVIGVDTAGRITLMNRNSEIICACTAGQVLGQPLQDTLRIVVHDGPSFSELLGETLNGRQIDFSRYSPQLLRPDGRTLDIYCSGAPIFSPQPVITGAVFVISDITSHRQLEEEMLNMKKLESIGLLAGGIAHDFNNILTGILGNISLARLYAQRGKDFDDKLKAAEQASLKAQELTQQFLTFSKGGQPVKQSESIVEMIEASTQFLLHGSKIIGRFQFAPDLWQAHIDRGQITQVLNNLIINAKQAMSQGGELTISADNFTVSESQESPLSAGEYICITVADQGIGIPRENLSKVFDPYFSTKPNGHGLGLTSSFHILKRHGGLITVESEPGKGSKFSVYLPATRQKVTSLENDGELYRGQGTVIIMDDNPTVVDVVDQQLRHLGYQVIAVENSLELTELFSLARERDLRFDLIILDLTIPGDVGGEVALDRVRAIDPGIRAIVSSGYANNPVLAEYRRYGFNGKVCKPFHINELAREINRVLAG